jgi:hypothetical protein
MRPRRADGVPGLPYRIFNTTWQWIFGYMAATRLTDEACTDLLWGGNEFDRPAAGGHPHPALLPGRAARCLRYVCTAPAVQKQPVLANSTDESSQAALPLEPLSQLTDRKHASPPFGSPGAPPLQAEEPGVPPLQAAAVESSSIGKRHH